MKIGDKVKLKNHARNNTFKHFLNKVGTVIDLQDDKNKQFVRVKWGRTYEDLGSWRLSLVKWI